MDVLQLGRAKLAMIITVIVAVIVIAIAFPFHQEIEAFFRQTLPAWLQANLWVQWVFSGIGVAILGGLYKLWGSSRSTPHAAPAINITNATSRSGGLRAQDGTGKGVNVQEVEVERDIDVTVTPPGNTPPKT